MRVLNGTFLFSIFVCVCVLVCVRERNTERERELFMCPWMTQNGVIAPGAGVQGGYEPLNMAAELSSGPLEE